MTVKNRTPPADRSVVTLHVFCFSMQTRIRRGFGVFLSPQRSGCSLHHLHPRPGNSAALELFHNGDSGFTLLFSTATKCHFIWSKKSNICDQSGLIYSWRGYRRLLNKVSSTPKSNICTLSTISIYPSSEFYLSSLR